MEIGLTVIAAIIVILPFLWPHWRKREIARERKKKPQRKRAGGLIAPFDEVFHPMAYSAHLLWEAEQSIPAPAPNADDIGPDFANGRITIHVDDNKQGH